MDSTDQVLPAPPEIVERVAPEAAAALSRLQALVPAVTDPVLAELVRLRLGHFLGDELGVTRRSGPARALGLAEEQVADLPQWPTSGRYSDVERACLALAEQYVIDVSAVADADTEAVLEHLGPAGLYGFVQALYVIDESIRLDLALGAVFAEAPATSSSAPIGDGSPEEES